MQLHCARCESVTLHSQYTPNHVAHLIGALLTMGIWLLVWLIVAVLKNPARCIKCGLDRPM